MNNINKNNIHDDNIHKSNIDQTSRGKKEKTPRLKSRAEYLKDLLESI